LTPTELAGQADMPIPCFHHGQVLAQIMSRHTDILTAENGIIKAKWNLLLAKVTPIPDIDLRVMLQKDYTSNTFLLTPSVVVGGTVPIWDQNQGNIMQAQGQLAHAQEDVQRTRHDLTARLAEAFERYETNRQQLEYYRDHILPDLVQVYHGSVLRYKADTKNPLTFLDIVTPQQNLAGGIATYLSTLQGLWTAVVDVASLLQTDDLFGLVQGSCIEPMADLAGLVVVPPPGRSCRSGEDPRLLVPNPHWPSAGQPRVPQNSHPEVLPDLKPELLPTPRSNPDKPAEPIEPEKGSSDQPGPAGPLLQLPSLPEVKKKSPRVHAQFAADRPDPLAIPPKDRQVTPTSWGQQR
jgi:cobalt-zinc-cadmium efflux system outer membrane protein